MECRNCKGHFKEFEFCTTYGLCDMCISNKPHVDKKDQYYASMINLNYAIYKPRSYISMYKNGSLSDIMMAGVYDVQETGKMLDIKDKKCITDSFYKNLKDFP